MTKHLNEQKGVRVAFPGNFQQPIRAIVDSEALMGAAHKGLLVSVGVFIDHACDAFQHLGKGRVLHVCMHGCNEAAGTI